MNVHSLRNWEESDERREPTQARQWLAAAEDLLSEVGSTVTGMVEGALCEVEARGRHPDGLPGHLAGDVDGRR